MSNLFAALGNTAQALDAQSIAIAVTSKNIANVNNSNYSREYVVFGNQGEVMTPQGEESLGLEATSVQQYSDSLLNKQVVGQISLTSASSAEQSWLQQAQAGLGQNLTDASSSTSSSTTAAGDNGIASAIDSFMSAFSAYAAQPNDSGTSEQLVSAASTLSQTFQSVDANLAQVQANANSQTASDITTANNLLSNIASLNTQIAAAEVNQPGSAVDLRDSRQADLQQLAAIIPVSTTEASNGEDLVTTPGAGGSSITLVQQGTVQGSLAYSGGVVTGGASAATLSLGGGSIQGAISASTGPIQTLRDSLDNLADQIVTSVNSAYNPTSASGGNFFDAAGTTAGTIALDPGLSATTLVAGTGAAGDNSIANAVAALANQSFSTGSGDAINGTYSTYYADSVGNFGESLSNTSNTLDDQQNVQTLLQNQQSSISGVNMDEEMSSLVQFQRSYEASSETFSVLNQLIGEVISELGGSAS